MSSSISSSSGSINFLPFYETYVNVWSICICVIWSFGQSVRNYHNVSILDHKRRIMTCGIGEPSLFGIEYLPSLQLLSISSTSCTIYYALTLIIIDKPGRCRFSCYNTRKTSGVGKYWIYNTTKWVFFGDRYFNKHN